MIRNGGYQAIGDSEYEDEVWVTLKMKYKHKLHVTYMTCLLPGKKENYPKGKIFQGFALGKLCESEVVGVHDIHNDDKDLL